MIGLKNKIGQSAKKSSTFKADDFEGDIDDDDDDEDEEENDDTDIDETN